LHAFVVPDALTPPEIDQSNPAGGADVMAGIAHHAVLAAACQFIPIPFVDDLAERRVRRAMVSKLLAARGRAFDADAVVPLWKDEGGGVLSKVGGFAKGLVLKPVKKLLRTVFIVFTIRRAILEAAEMLLLGHTLDRLLAAGQLADADTPPTRQAQATQIAAAVAGVMASPDRRALVQLVRDTARRFRSWRDKSAPVPAPVAATADDAAAVEATLSSEQQAKLGAASSELAGRLRDDEGQSLLARIDAAVDARLQA
jgi:uncharacterized protein (DUF697 family)